MEITLTDFEHLVTQHPANNQLRAAWKEQEQVIAEKTNVDFCRARDLGETCFHCLDLAEVTMLPNNSHEQLNVPDAA